MGNANRYNMGMKFKVLFFSLCLPLSLFSIEFEDAVFPEIITSGRALAMGNAFLCKVDDSTAAFYNPAGLGTVRYPHFHLSNFHVEVNRGWMDIGTGGRLTDTSGNFVKAFSLDGTRELLNEKRGKLSHSRFHFLPNFTTRYFSAGYLLSKRTLATVGTDPTDQFEYATRLDHGPYAAINFSFMGGVFKIGATGMFIRRKEAYGEADPAVAIDLKSSDYNKGTALLFTSGARVTLPWTYLPTFAVNVHNVTGQRFTKDGAGRPRQVKQTFDFGFSITPQIGRASRVHLEVNYKDGLQRYSGVSQVRRILFGLEFDFARTMFFRLGYGDGYGSGGIGIRTRKLEFDLTTYAVDTTSSEFRGKEDRRFALTLSSGF